MNLQTERTEDDKAPGRNGLEPGEEGAWPSRGGRRRDRKILREAQVRSSTAAEISSDPAEVWRNDAADDLGLHPDMGMAIRAWFCPPFART